MLLANTEFDTSQDIPQPPGWFSDDAQSSTRETYQPRRRPHRGRYQPRNNAYRLSRDDLREMALSTLGTLDDGFYTYQSHGKDVKVDLTDPIEYVAKETSYFGPDWDGEADGERVFPDNEEDAPSQSAVEEQEDVGDGSPIAEINSDLSETAEDETQNMKEHVNASQDSPTASDTDATSHPELTPTASEEKGQASLSEKVVLERNRETPINIKTRIIIAEYSTLVGTRKLHQLLEHDANVKNKTIGVLNFASAKKPGGGFLNGSQAQEESLARTSTLYPSLLTPTAQRFYGHWQADPSNALYTHSIVYSPSVVIFRNDKGDWKSPIAADMLTCAAVNAGEIRDRIKWEQEQREMDGRAHEVAQNMWKLAEKRKAEEQVIRREEMKGLKEVRAEMEGVANELERSLKMLQEKSEGRADEESKPEDGKMEVDEQETQRAVEIGEQISSVEGRMAEIQDKIAEIDREMAQLADELNDTHVQTPKIDMVMDHQLDMDASERVLSGQIGVKGDIFEDASEELSKHQDLAANVEGLSDKLSEADNPFASPEDKNGLPPAPEPIEQPSSQQAHMTLEEAEVLIASEMKERVFRILKVFQKQGAQHLVLGSFGTGVFQNEVDVVAGIFRELLVGSQDTSNADDAPKAPFKDVFSNVVFAILGGGTVRVFENVFEGVSEKDAEVIGGSDDDEPMGGADEVPQHGFWDKNPATTTETHAVSTVEHPLQDASVSEGHVQLSLS